MSESKSKETKKKKIRFSVGFKLITITSLIVTLALGGMIFLASYFFRDDNEIRIKENTLQVAGLIGQQVQTDFVAVVDKVRVISSILQNEQRQRAGDTLGVQGIFDSDREIILAAIVSKNAAGEPYVQERLVNQHYVFEQGFASDQAVVDMIAPSLHLFEGSFLGQEIVRNPSVMINMGALAISVPYQGNSILLIFMRAERFAETVRPQGITRSYIVTGSGELLAHYDETQVIGGANYAQSPIVQAMLRSPNPNGQIPFQLDGVSYLGSFQKVTFSDVGVIVYVEEDKAFAAVYSIQRRNLLITALVLNFAILIVYFFAKTITRPVKRLMNASIQVKEGQYDLDIKATARDEIGNLTESFVEMAQGLAERERMKEAFGKFVNKEIAERAMRGELKLGGERRDVAIFFSDIRSFTAISESLEPEEVVEFLNEYMTRMVDCVSRTNGVVDKFIGDAIMAIWGTPVSYGNDIENAINGSLMMRTALLDFNKGRGGPKKPIIQIGCGLNIGPVIAGQIGSQERMEYTVIGDAVNLASRVESLNKPFGTDILITEEAYERVKDIYITQLMQKIKVKGKAAPQSVYAVIGRRDDPESPKTLDEVRRLVGIDMSHVNPGKGADEGEVKYEIIE
jgi:adenylate cyclase